MKKAALIVLAVVVAVMFAVPAFAAESTPCNTCAKPCNTCAKPCVKPCPKPCATPCAKPCNTCTTPCMPLPKVCVDWKWPSMKVECPAPCPAPCAQVCPEYKRDVMGQKIPNQTVKAGNAMSDKATNYENTLVTGQ
jgi:hypothetical protein